MFKHDIAGPSASSWASSCLLVPKSDNIPRFLMTFEKVTGSQDQAPFHCFAWRTAWTRLVQPSMSASLIC